MSEAILKQGKILIVDDEKANVRLLEIILQQAGYTEVHSTTDARQAHALFCSIQPDIVLLDLSMPHLDGFAVMQQFHQERVNNAVPILVLTVDTTSTAKHRALKEGARDFLTKPLDGIEVLLRIHNLLETRFYRVLLEAKVQERTQDNKVLERRVLARTVQLNSANQMLEADLTARKRAEAQQHVLQKVREQVWKMNGINDIHQVLIAIRTGLEAQQLAFHGCGINLLDLTADPPTIRFHHITREKKWTFSDTRKAREVLLQIWRSGKVIYRPDLEAEDLYGEQERVQKFSPGIRSLIDVPFSHGTLLLNSIQPAAFSTLDIKFLQELAEVLSEGFRRLDDLQTIETTEAQLRQAQKLESLGQLAGGVAHDFNNLLTVTSGYTELLMRRLTVDHPDYALLQEISSAAEKGTGLVRQLLAFSRKQVLEPRVLDLNAVVRNLEKILGQLIGEGIELVVRLAPDLGRVKADQGQLEQVLMNLGVNARDAMPQGGKLTIETHNVELDQPHAVDHTAGEPGPYVLLEVNDTGTGMDAATQARIFEPFFTTKELGKGTGLGLATVYGIVKQSGGHIGVYSEPGQGTSFKIYLPRLEEQVQAVVPGEVLQPVGGSETLLLVEDEAPLRKMATHLLREWGYTVLEASHGEEAMQLSAQHQGPLHAVVSDMVMPGMSGPTLVEQLLALRPELKVLYVSGYSEDVVQQRAALKSGDAFLQKPFRANALLLKVREVLDGVPPR